MRLSRARAQAKLRNVLAYRDVQVLCAFFLAAQLLDALTTFLALRTHRFEEANPWFAGALAVHPVTAYATKMTIALAVMLALLLMRIRWRLRLAVMVLFTVASMVAPAANALRLANVL
jgi:hypothetical protein